MEVVSHLIQRIDAETSNPVGREGDLGVLLSAAAVVRGVIPRRRKIDVVVIHREEAGVAATVEAIAIAEEDVNDLISLHLQSQDLVHDLPKAIAGNTTSMKVGDFISQVVAGILTTTLLEMVIVAIRTEETIETTIAGGLTMIDRGDRTAVRIGVADNSVEEIQDVVEIIKPRERKCVGGKRMTMRSQTNSCSERLEFLK